MDPFIGSSSHTEISTLSSLSQMQSTESYQCEAHVECANAPGSSITIVKTGHATASTDTSDTATRLPLSIVPSDITGSLVGSSIPTTLVTDTSSVDAPTFTWWRSSPTLSGSITGASASASPITIIGTGQSTAEETTVPLTIETLTSYSSQPSPTATGVITRSTASASTSVSTPVDSSEQSPASTKSNAMCGLNKLSTGLLGLWTFAFIAAWI